MSHQTVCSDNIMLEYVEELTEIWMSSKLIQFLPRKK